MKKKNFLPVLMLVGLGSSLLLAPVVALAEVTEASATSTTDSSATELVETTVPTESTTSDSSTDQAEPSVPATSASSNADQEEPLVPATSTSSSTSQVDDSASSSSTPSTGEIGTESGTQPAASSAQSVTELEKNQEHLSSKTLAQPTENSTLVQENLGVTNPIHLRLSGVSYAPSEFTLHANIDWQPQKLDTIVDVVDIKGRLMYRSRYLNIYNLSDYIRINAQYYPNGIYTVIVRGETDYRNGNQKFLGRIAFKIENYRFAGEVPVPAATSNMTGARDKVYVGTNSIRLEPSRYYGGSVRIEGFINWLPYYYEGDTKVYDVKGRLMKTISNYSFNFGDRLHDYTSFDVSDFPDGIYIIVSSGKTDERNGNQSFYGRAAFEVRSGQYFQKTEVPQAFLSIINAQPVYRLYNPSRGVYLYSSKQSEVRLLINSGDWRNEGIGWKSPVQGQLVYRLRHPQQRTHFYTRNYNEYLLKGQQGWIPEGRAFHSGGNVAIYRVRNPRNGQYLFTQHISEVNTKVRQGWTNEGIGWYGMPKN